MEAEATVDAPTIDDLLLDDDKADAVPASALVEQAPAAEPVSISVEPAEAAPAGATVHPAEPEDPAEHARLHARAARFGLPISAHATAQGHAAGRTGLKNTAKQQGTLAAGVDPSDPEEVAKRAARAARFALEAAQDAALSITEPAPCSGRRERKQRRAAGQAAVQADADGDVDMEGGGREARRRKQRQGDTIVVLQEECDVGGDAVMQDTGEGVQGSGVSSQGFDPMVGRMGNDSDTAGPGARPPGGNKGSVFRRIVKVQRRQEPAEQLYRPRQGSAGEGGGGGGRGRSGRLSVALSAALATVASAGIPVLGGAQQFGTVETRSVLSYDDL